jgi:xanthine phosphoribosyltransferase
MGSLHHGIPLLHLEDIIKGGGMKELKEKILAEGKNMGGGILNVNSFLNHQVDCELMVHIGQELAQRFASDNANKILTAEISGIAPALEVGVALGVPVVFARKIWSVTMPKNCYVRMVPSHTKGTMVQLIVAPDFLNKGDRVLIIDDFLATGRTVEALAHIVGESDADLVGFGAVIEKAFEGGRARLAGFNVPIESVVIIESMEGDKIVFR